MGDEGIMAESKGTMEHAMVLYDPSGADDFDKYYQLGKHGDGQYWSEYLDQAKLSEFSQAAYEDSKGYSIRYNPVTGYKELFIAGSRPINTGRGILDWVQNATEGIAHTGEIVGEALQQIPDERFQEFGEGLDRGIEFLDVSERYRDKFSDLLDKIVEEEGIQVVYGHSRGAAIMSGMKSNVKKIGLDGASFIGHEDDYINLIQAPGSNYGLGAFDNLIAVGHGKNNIRLPGRMFHDVTLGENIGTKKKTVKADLVKKKKKGKIFKEFKKTKPELKASKQAKIAAEKQARAHAIGRAVAKKALTPRAKRANTGKKETPVAFYPPMPKFAPTAKPSARTASNRKKKQIFDTSEVRRKRGRTPEGIRASGSRRKKGKGSRKYA